MKTYNEFASEMRKKGKKQAEISKAWKEYKTGSLKTVKKVAVTLSPEVKAINKKLTEKNKELQELRAKKKAGKDVKADIKKVLKYLAENREKKKAMK